MKVQLGLALLTLTAASAGAGTDRAWVKTDFWTAPHINEFPITLSGREQLAIECATFKKEFAQGTSRLSDIRYLNRSVSLPLNIKPGLAVERRIQIISKDEKKSIPHYEQKVARTGVLLEELDFRQLTFTPKKHSFSYTELYKGYSAPTIAQLRQDSKNGGMYLYLTGREVACDLYEGNGTLSLKVPSYVIVDEKGHKELVDFYNKVLMPEITEIYSKGENNVATAARYGFRIGKILDDKEGKLVDQVMKQIFLTNSIIPNSKVNFVDKKYEVTIGNKTDAPEVEVTLTLNNEEE